MIAIQNVLVYSFSTEVLQNLVYAVDTIQNGLLKHRWLLHHNYKV